MDRILKIIIDRLKDKGTDLDKIPACIETIFNILLLCPDPNCHELNRRMQLLGWPDFEIDEHTFKLVKLVYDNSETVPALR